MKDGIVTRTQATRYPKGKDPHYAIVDLTGWLDDKLERYHWKVISWIIVFASDETHTVAVGTCVYQKETE